MFHGFPQSPANAGEVTLSRSRPVTYSLIIISLSPNHSVLTSVCSWNVITGSFTSVCIFYVQWQVFISGSCEHGNEPSGAIISGKYLDKLSDQYLFKKVSLLHGINYFVTSLPPVRYTALSFWRQLYLKSYSRFPKPPSYPSIRSRNSSVII
jgi:hypothetical protein